MNVDHLNRALRAAQAVTLGGAFVAACGTTPTDPDSDASTDVGADASTDSTTDTAPDAATCSTEIDDVCPATCTADDDADCCALQEPAGWCSLNPGFGCQCAVEGPFAPPSVAAGR